MPIHVNPVQSANPRKIQKTAKTVRLPDWLRLAHSSTLPYWAVGVKCQSGSYVQRRCYKHVFLHIFGTRCAQIIVITKNSPALTSLFLLCNLGFWPKKNWKVDLQNRTYGGIQSWGAHQKDSEYVWQRGYGVFMAKLWSTKEKTKSVVLNWNQWQFQDHVIKVGKGTFCSCVCILKALSKILGWRPLLTVIDWSMTVLKAK